MDIAHIANKYSANIQTSSRIRSSSQDSHMGHTTAVNIARYLQTYRHMEQKLSQENNILDNLFFLAIEQKLCGF